MDFIFENREGNNIEIYQTRISERFDPLTYLHVFSLDKSEDKEVKDLQDIFTINARTGEFKWLSDVAEEIKNDKETQFVINRFKDSTCLINKDASKINDWLKEKIESIGGIGFINEFRISVTGQDIDGEKIWWVIKRQRSFGPFGKMGMPVFIVRYMNDENASRYKVYGEPATPVDIHIGKDDEFEVQKLVECLSKDINMICKDIYDLTVDFRHRV